ncbi:MAG: hypothetical protein ACKV19_22090 [Verrucomicrobiales bacterium]
MTLAGRIGTNPSMSSEAMVRGYGGASRRVAGVCPFFRPVPKLTNNRVGGEDLFRLLGIVLVLVLVLVLEVAAPLTALTPTLVTLPVHRSLIAFPLPPNTEYF